MNALNVLCVQLTCDLFAVAKFLLKKNSDSVWNELNSVWFEKNMVQFGYYSYLLLT